MSADEPIYLDHNATTPLLPEVLEAMLPHLRGNFGNPSSGHVYGQRARAAVERARAQVAALLGCAAEEVIFTSGGTEANNLAIRGVMEARGGRGGVVTSVIEHPATARPCDWLERGGVPVTRLGVDAWGEVRLDEAARAITAETALITVMHANNETGAIQPVEALARLGRAAGALTHADAAQSAGKVPVDVEALGVELLTLAGHKLYGPKGVGALYVRRGVALSPLLLGAGHERGLRPGTESVASLVGLGAACEAARRDQVEVAGRMERLREALYGALAAAVPGLRLHGHPARRLPNTLNVSFPGVLGGDVLARAPEVAASTGSACHAGQVSASSVLLAMGVPVEEALGAVRLTLGRDTGEADVEVAASALTRAWRALTARG
jgi:cysteine desulfurase